MGEDAFTPTVLFFVVLGEILALLLVSFLGGKLVTVMSEGCKRRRSRLEEPQACCPRVCCGVQAPPLLGMLLAGMLFANIPGDPTQHIPSMWSSSLRRGALTVILIRAGVGMDIAMAWALRSATLRLACIPCVVEACVAAAASVAFLGLPVEFAAALGCLLSAVSPSVVVPSLLLLQQERRGVAKGVPTLVLTAASFDNVLVITAFALCTAHALSSVGVGPAESDSLFWTIALGAPLQLGAGILAGWLLSLIVGRAGIVTDLPAESDGSSESAESGRRGGAAAEGAAVDRHHTDGEAPVLILADQDPRAVATLLVIVSLGLVQTASMFHATGAGYLAAMSLALLAGRWWSPARKKEIGECLSLLWVPVQYLLFGLIGAAVRLSDIDEGMVVGGLGVIGVGGAARILSTFLSVGCAGLNVYEMAFVSLAWLPKATVQAAIGSEIMDAAVRAGAPAEVVHWGRAIRTVAILSILVTAPLGALAIAIVGPRWLTRDGELLVEPGENTPPAFVAGRVLNGRAMASI